MTSKLRCGGFISTLIALALFLLGAGSGDETQVASGRRLYRIYCLNCHGESGRGDGPMTAVLDVEVADLTRLARRNGGTFPASRIEQAIDGRYEVSAHGRRAMPVWGLSFQVTEQGTVDEREVRALLQDLVAYLRSIQEGSGDRGE